ncbi:MAG: cytochrome b/b6 domain-containing protein [Anaerolineales bacterium]|jgi:formate dehydrogenase gamma subunit
MTHNNSIQTGEAPPVQTERTFKRFTLTQRWEHAVLVLSFIVLLLTGLPQKYRGSAWSQQILSTPERLEFIQTIHHIAAIVLIVEALYHIGKGIYLLSRRQLSAAIFPTMKDVKDALQMVKYLLFLSKDKPAHSKYNFEQKFTYWFVFFGIGIMILSGLMMWFPIFFTRFLPGGIIPAALLAHSSEAIAATVFILIWHTYHVHIERLNLSIFTGRLSEREMREYHELEYQALTKESGAPSSTGENE